MEILPQITVSRKYKSIWTFASQTFSYAPSEMGTLIQNLYEKFDSILGRKAEPLFAAVDGLLLWTLRLLLL